MSIVVEQLSKNYGNQVAVNGISFTVGKGEIVGFLGPNGAGKTTTMKMITGYIPPTHGRIQVCNMPVTVTGIATKQCIGYLPESNPLYTEMYVREYLHFIAKIHQLNHATEAVHKVVALVGLPNEANKKIHQLSKGYKQRVGLAAALIHNPQVLILDEPTTGLDPNQIIEIREIIKQLGKEKTILFSSHILQEVEAICDRIIIIHKGNIVANDSLHNLRQSTQPTVLVQANKHIDTSILSSIVSVTHVQQLNEHTYTLTCTQVDYVKKTILELSVAHQFNVLQLSSSLHSLESIFKSLTTEAITV